jgi:hypothetical protein
MIANSRICRYKKPNFVDFKQYKYPIKFNFYWFANFVEKIVRKKSGGKG